VDRVRAAVVGGAGGEDGERRARGRDQAAARRSATAQESHPEELRSRSIVASRRSWYRGSASRMATPRELRRSELCSPRAPQRRRQPDGSFPREAPRKQEVRALEELDRP